MKQKNEKALDEFIEYSLRPCLYDDVEYKDEEEFQNLKQYLVDAIQDIEYIQQYEDTPVDEDDL